MMLEPTIAELTSCPNQPGNQAKPGYAIKEITMHRRRPPADHERPGPPAPGTAAIASPALAAADLLQRRQLMCHDLLVIDLATRARDGEKQAWDAIVERYSPLIWSICRCHRLGNIDAKDVGQAVWLQLVSQLAHFRDPAALPGWLAATTQQECRRILRARCRPPGGGDVPKDQNIPDDHSTTAEHELLLAERDAALREAFTRLPPDHQRLLALLITAPPMPYAQISARLGIPAESIEPYRSRCLDKLRRDPAIAALISTATASSRPPGLTARDGGA